MRDRRGARTRRGTVRVDSGICLIGTIELRTGVTLLLEKDATLLGSPRIADYRRGNGPALILARNQSHLAIIGDGAIDGQGKSVARDTLRIFESGNYVDFFQV